MLFDSIEKLEMSYQIIKCINQVRFLKILIINLQIVQTI